MRSCGTLALHRGHNPARSSRAELRNRDRGVLSCLVTRRGHPVRLRGYIQMRKTVVLLVSTAFVAALPSIASAKKPKNQRQPVVQAYNDVNAGGRLVADALHQLIVPLEVTFTPRRY